MTVTVANTANTNTFDYWRNRTNELAYAMSTYAVTAGGSNTAVGNAAISGVFTAGSLSLNTGINIGNSTVNAVVNTSTLFVGNSSVNATITGQSLTIGGSIYVGNTTSNLVATTTSVKLSNSTSNIAISIPTSTKVSNGQYFLAANGNWTLIEQINPISSVKSLVGTSTQDVDNFAKASYFAAEYLVYVKDNVANNRSVSKMVVFHDGGTSVSNAFITEYAVMNSNSGLGVFGVYTNATHTILQYTPTSPSVTLNFTRLVT